MPKRFIRGSLEVNDRKKKKKMMNCNPLACISSYFDAGKKQSWTERVREKDRERNQR